MKEFDPIAIHHYLSYKHVPQPMSATKGKIRDVISVRCPTFAPPLDLSETEIIDELDKRLIECTKKLITGKTIVLCSGGIDSGIVTAIASKLSKIPVVTYNMTYGDDNTGGKKLDLEYARTISKRYRTAHHEFEISFRDIAHHLPDILSIIGEPFSGYVSPWFIGHELFNRNVRCVLTGDWGDELFGSYWAHRDAFQKPKVEGWAIRCSDFVFNEAEKGVLYADGCWPGVSTSEHVKQYFQGLTAPDSLNRMLESEYKSFYPDQTYLSFYLLTKCWNVEALSPYSDPYFADFAARIPMRIKMKGGEPKYILKKLAERYLPKEIVYRKKEGFVTPTKALCLGLKLWILLKLEPKRLPMFKPEVVRGLVDRFYQLEEEKDSYKLWNLVSLSVWLNEVN